MAEHLKSKSTGGFYHADGSPCTVYLSWSDEHLAVLAVVDGDGVGVVEEVDAAVLAVPHDHLLSCKIKEREKKDMVRG